MAPLVNPTKHSWGKKKKRQFHTYYSKKVKTCLPHFTRAALSWYQTGQMHYEKTVDNIPPGHRCKILYRTSANQTNYTLKERDIMTSGVPLRNEAWFNIWKIRYSPLSMDRKEKPHHHRKDEGRRVTKFTIHSREAQRSGNGRKLLQPGDALKERSAD